MKEQDNTQNEHQTRVDALSKLISGGAIFVNKETMPKTLPSFRMAEIILGAQEFEGIEDIDSRLAERYGTTRENVRRTFVVFEEIKQALDAFQNPYDTYQILSPEVEVSV